MNFGINNIKRISYFDNYAIRLNWLFNDIDRFNDEIIKIKCKFEISDMVNFKKILDIVKDCEFKIKNALNNDHHREIFPSKAHNSPINQLKLHFENCIKLINGFFSKIKVKKKYIYIMKTTNYLMIYMKYQETKA
ncbi:hypothetical protein DMUE_1630 [Dictyocoela muelleri]|nr:hypothetical protein DMUE_1630 [Dictyocoela muelleri]